PFFIRVIREIRGRFRLFAQTVSCTPAKSKGANRPSRGRPVLLDLLSSTRSHAGASPMYAVFVDGSRQYRVSEGDLVKVDFRDVEQGGRVEFGRVLLYANGDDLRIGQPIVEGVRVLGD